MNAHCVTLTELLLVAVETFTPAWLDSSSNIELEKEMEDAFAQFTVAGAELLRKEVEVMATVGMSVSTTALPAETAENTRPDKAALADACDPRKMDTVEVVDEPPARRRKAR